MGDPQNAVAWYGLGWAHHHLGAVQKAVQCFRSALEVKSHAPTSFKVYRKREGLIHLLQKWVGESACMSLKNAGFDDCGSVLVHTQQGITVEPAPKVEGDLDSPVHITMDITVDGIDAEDLSDWTALQLREDIASFGSRLLDWTSAQRSPEPGFNEDSSEDSAAGLEFLPSADELGVMRERALHILTWGNALMKSAPASSEFNFNAGILNGRGGGADLRTMNGLSEEVQNNVASFSLFPGWLKMVISKVESVEAKVISINCTKGRHRSVAAAEILHKYYYPASTVQHLTIR